MKKIIQYVIIASMMFSVAKAQGTHDAVVGTWLVQDGSGKVKIEKVGDKYTGKLVWIKNPTDKTGKPLTDSKNPDVAMRNRPQMGLPLLQNFVFDEENHWTSGTIYDPDEGKTYSCKMTMKDNQTLEVRGYVGISLFGRTDTWKRVDDITMK